MRIALIVLALTVVEVSTLQAQTRYEKYDSIFYERIFSPTFSTMMMPKGYVEVIVNNSLLTTNNFRGDDSKLQNYNARYTYNYSILQTNFGVSSSSRFSVGLDFYYTFARKDADPNSSPFNVFNSNAAGNIQSANALTGIAPRLKFVPFKRYKNFIFQTSLFLPTVTNAQVKSFVSSDQTVLRNQFLYSIRVSDKFMSFAQADIDVSFKKNANSSNSYSVPVNLYLYWLATKHIFPYASIGYATIIQKVDATYKNNIYYLPVTGGVQYQFSMRFNVNVNYSRYLMGRNFGDWSSVNLGLRGVF